MFQRLLPLLLAVAGCLPAADQIAFVAGTQYAVESDTSVPLTLVRNGDLAGEASVQVAVNPFGFLYPFTAAVAGTDHAFATTTVIFAAGQRLATVTVPILADAVADGNRFVALSLTAPVNATVATGGEAGLATSAAVGIIDDEAGAGGGGPLLINPLDTYNSSFGEAAGSIRVPVLRQGATTDALTASWAISDGSGTITPLTGTLTWAAGAGGTRYVDAALANTPGDDRNRTYLLTVTSGSTVATHTINVMDAVGLPGGFIAVSGLMPLLVEEPALTPTTVSCWFERIRGSAGAVTMSVALQIPAQASDVTLLTTSLTWADGEGGRKAVQLQVLPDDLAELSEYITLSLTLDAGSRAGFAGYSDIVRTSAQQVLHILANDQAGNQSWLGFSNPQWAVVEGGAATIAVERFGNLAAAASATFAITNSSSQNADWSAAPATGLLSWAAGEGGVRTVALSAVQDALSEPAELVRVSLSGITGATLAGSGSVDVAILDDDFQTRSDAAGLSRIEFLYPGSTTSVTEGGSASLLLRRTGPAPEAASVTLVPAAATAVPGSDFPLAPITVSWAAGETGDRFATIPTSGDALGEDYEYFTVWISAPVGAATQVGPNQVTVGILDDDGFAAAPEFTWETVTSGTVDEAVGTVTVNLVRSGGSGAVSVHWALNTPTDSWHSFASKADVSGATSGTLSWADGEAGAKPITIAIVDDTVADNGAYLRITAIPTAGEPGAFSSPYTDLWVRDNDSPAQEPEYVGVLLDAPSYLIPEGGSQTITLRRAGRHSGPVAVRVASFNSGVNAAVPGVDYTLSALSVSWADGDLADKTITLTALTDALVLEPDEEVRVDFTVDSGNAQVTSYAHRPAGTVLWTISNQFRDALIDQAASAAGDILATSVQTVFTEGVDSALTLTLGRVGGASGAVTVSYATLMENFVDEARQGSDYTPVAGTVTWADGDSAAKTISIPLLDDALVEFPERVRLYLALSAGQARTVVPGWLFTIADNDANAVTPGLRFASAGASAPESGGALTVTVQRTGALTGSASVDLTVSGSATLGADFALSATTVSFVAGAATAAVTLTPVDDGAGDPGETVVLTLANPSAGLVLLVPANFTATLTEAVDTTAPTVSVTTVGGRTPAGGTVTVARSPAAVVIAASDDVAVHQVTATLNGGAVTVAVAGAGWQIAAMPLALGANTLVVTARDAAGNEAQASVAVTFRPTQTFTLHDTFVVSGTGAPVTTTPALLGLAAGDLRRFDPSTKTLVDVPADAELTPGVAYTLKEGVAAPALPPAGHDAVPATAGRLDGLAQGWNLRTVTGGQAAEWSPDTVSAVIDGAPAVTLAQAIAAGQLRPYCWAYNPADGSVRLITRDPAKVPGSSSTIPAGWNVWLPSGHGGTIQLIFAPAGRG